MAHDHDHHDGHDHHDHEHPQAQRHVHHHDGSHHHHGHHGAIGNLKVAFFLNLGFAILEIFGGIFTNSMAILSDALHDLGDSLALGMAWYLERVAAKESDRAYSYGYARFSVLGAFINSVVLIVGSVFILLNTIPRLLHPEVSDAKGMIVFCPDRDRGQWRGRVAADQGQNLERARGGAATCSRTCWAGVAILVGSIVMLFADVPHP